MQPLSPLQVLMGTDTSLVRAQKIIANVDAIRDTLNVVIAIASGADLLPIAKFTFAQPDTMSVVVDATTSTDADGTIVDYLWSFGDGALASGSTATHTYRNAGVYTVALTVTDDSGGTSTAATSVVATSTVNPVNDPPVAAFTPTVAADGYSLAVDASDSYDADGTVTAYAWTFGDGAAASGKTATHVYSQSGNFTVKLIVTDDDGASTSVSKIVTITVPSTPTNPTPGSGDTGVNQTGTAGRQQTGSGIVLYQNMPGSVVGDKVNAGAGSVVSLPSGTFAFNDFAQAIGSGVPAGAAIANTVKGIYGAGSGSTVLEMTPNTSTKTYPTGSGSTTNPSYLMGVKGSTPNGFVIDGIMLLGTTQGNPDFNGFWTQNPTNMTVSNSTFKHCHGSAGGPPGETFAFNVYAQGSGTINFRNCTFDGDNVGAAGLGTNTTSGTINIDNCVASNMAQSAGVATWENRGTINVRNLVMRNNHRNFGAETNAGVINITDPDWGEPTAGNDFNITWTNNFNGGVINVYFTSAAAWQKFIATRTTKKIKVVTNTKQNYGGSAGTSYTGSGDIWANFNVYVGGIKQVASNYVSFTGNHTA